MSKVYRGQVSVVLNTKGEVALKGNSEGKFNSDNATELHQVILSICKDKGYVVNQWSLYKPVGVKAPSPVLLANRFGQPYLALLDKVAGRKSSTTVLA